MKAHVIISTEFKYNTPHIFAITEHGDFIGNLIYPSLRGMERNINYWKSATCADDGRYFGVYDANIDENDYVRIKDLHNLCQQLTRCLKPTSNWEANRTPLMRAITEHHDREVIKFNAPYWTSIEAAEREIKTLIVRSIIEDLHHTIEPCTQY